MFNDHKTKEDRLKDLDVYTFKWNWADTAIIVFLGIALATIIAEYTGITDLFINSI